MFTRDSARATPVKGKTDIEDDQETVLDITGKSKLICKSEQVNKKRCAKKKKIIIMNK